jgi:hypothetical protein
MNDGKRELVTENISPSQTRAIGRFPHMSCEVARPSRPIHDVYAEAAPVGERSGKLYWSNREGMRVMRANLDGTEIETLVDTSLGDSRPGSDQRKWCVGIAVDTDGGKFYWTQKGGHDAGPGRICRANIQVPQGQSAQNRRDIELLYDNLPEPIDLDLDPVNRTPCRTDRGDPPRGNTVNRAPMDPEAQIARSLRYL